MKKIILFLTLVLIQLFGFAQAPNISYPSGTHTYNTGTVISPLTPTNTGGAVPATIYGEVSTLAGTAPSFYHPSGVAIDAAGNVYVADSDNNKIRKTTTAGVVTTLAGSGKVGSADGTGTTASFSYPFGVAVDVVGNVYVADTGNQTIRKITAAGVVTTLAGSGSIGSADGTGTAASFNWPCGVAVDEAGNVYVADYLNNKIRKITATGVVTTLAGSGSIGSADGTGAAASFYNPFGVALDVVGNVYVADAGNNKIRKITTAGVVTTLAGSGSIGSEDGTGAAASFYYPFGVVVDLQGTVFVADNRNNKIRKITAVGVVTTLAGSGTGGSVDGTGTAASFKSPYGVTVDVAGNVFVADYDNHTIRKITATGVVTALAGSGSIGSADGTGAGANCSRPSGVAVDLAGTVYVADTNNHKIRKIIVSRVVSALAGSTSSGLEDGTATAASFSYPYGVAVDSGGNVYVADTGNHTIRKITPAGVVTTLAGSGYVNVNGTASSFNQPEGIAVDSGGNLYVADTGNNTIRKITAAGVVTTLPGSEYYGYGSPTSLYSPKGVAIDLAGNVYVADTGNNKIRKITASGVVTTLAGSGTSGSADGTGTAASFRIPTGVAVDAAGNVYVADYGNHKIRKITAVGVVTTLAGNGTSGLGDGIGTAASFYSPTGVAVDLGGNVYVADTYNNEIRKITAAGYVISPTLMAGLIFDQATGVISGTPTTSLAPTNYTVTACNAAGSSSTTVVIATTTLGTTTFSKQELKLYPNPVNSLLHIQTPNNISLDKVTIIDLTGKKVLEQTQNTSQVNVEHLANGMYIIEAFSGEEKLVSKFVKE